MLFHFLGTWRITIPWTFLPNIKGLGVNTYEAVKECVYMSYE